MSSRLFVVTRHYRGEPANRGAEIARALRKRLGQLRRVDIAVVRVPKRASKVIQSDERMPDTDLFGREHFVFHLVRSRHGADVFELVHSLPRVRQPDRSNDVVVDRIAHLVAEPAVECG
jgi:hypothetical protein